MDSRIKQTFAPLVVDLDGTLIATDLLWEGLFMALRQNPFLLFLVPFWALKGPARLKNEIAKRVSIDPAALPYRSVVMDEIHYARAQGREIILATGTPHRFADAIAAHLGVFDTVFASDEKLNLTSTNKLRKLESHYGPRGFDYIGDSRHDISIFEGANKALVVAPDRSAARWQKGNACDLLPTEGGGIGSIIRMLRVHQWLKNLLIFVPIFLSHQYFNPGMLWDATLAFIAFSAAASAIYIINDLFDLALDRAHQTKRHRPFASGALSLPFGLFCSMILLSISAVASFTLPYAFWGVLGLYLVTTSLYSLTLKRMLMVDVLTLAGLYTIRVLAGQAASNVETSFWLLCFSIFFFLSLALVKRYVELRSAVVEPNERIGGRGYRSEDQDAIAQAGMASAFASALVLALYIDSSSVREQYSHPFIIWPLALIILYIAIRIWILARRDEMHEDPVIFIIKDWRSQVMIIIGGALMVLAALIP